jgi:hypothetical protein
VETKFRMFGQAVSKYMIVSVCVMLWRQLTPRWKGYFIRISMVFFVLKGGEYALRYHGMDTTTPQATASKQLDIFFKENVLFISGNILLFLRLFLTTINSL